MFTKISSLILLFLIVFANAKRYYLIPTFVARDLIADNSEIVTREHKPRHRASDRSEHGNRGRVMIKVYRGPAEGDYAPHGYWVRQPADEY